MIRQNGLSPETEMLEPDKPQTPDEGLVGALRPNGIGDAAGVSRDHYLGSRANFV